MYGSTDEHPHGENVIFYLTVYNEPLVQPKEPENLDVEGLLRGIYQVADAPESAPDDAPKVQLLGSGVGFPWVTEAAQLLAEDWGVAAETWSVTSWNELARDGVAAEEWNFLHPSEEPRTPYVTDEAGGRRRARSSRSATTCARCPTRSRSGCPATTTPSAPTASASPTPGRRPALLPRRRRVGRGPGAGRPGPPRRGQARGGPGGVRPYRIDDPTAVAGVKQEGGDA